MGNVHRKITETVKLGKFDLGLDDLTTVQVVPALMTQAFEGPTFTPLSTVACQDSHAYPDGGQFRNRELGTCLVKRVDVNRYIERKNQWRYICLGRLQTASTPYSCSRHLILIIKNICDPSPDLQYDFYCHSILPMILQPLNSILFTNSFCGEIQSPIPSHLKQGTSSLSNSIRICKDTTVNFNLSPW